MSDEERKFTITRVYPRNIVYITMDGNDYRLERDDAGWHVMSFNVNGTLRKIADFDDGDRKALIRIATLALARYKLTGEPT